MNDRDKKDLYASISVPGFLVCVTCLHLSKKKLDKLKTGYRNQEKPRQKDLHASKKNCHFRGSMFLRCIGIPSFCYQSSLTHKSCLYKEAKLLAMNECQVTKT